MSIKTLYNDIRKFASQFTHLCQGISTRCWSCCEFKDRSIILWSILPILLLYTHLGSHQLIYVTILGIEYHTCTEAQVERRSGQCSDTLLTARTNHRTIISLNTTLEVTAVRVQLSKAIEPYRTAFHGAVKLQSTCPDISLAGISLLYIRKDQSTITLFYQAHAASKGATCQGMGIIGIFNLCILGSALAGSRTLHPRRGIVGKDSRRSTFSHVYSGIASSSEKSMLAIQCLGNRGTNLFSTCGGERWRSNGDTFQLAKEVGYMRWLIVAARLPYHAIAILMIVPQRIVTPLGWLIGGVDADIVVGCSLDNLLTPIAKDITLVARCCLGAIVGISTKESSYCSHTRLSYLCIIKTLLQKITIPINTEVHAKSIGIGTHMIICDRRDRSIVCTMTNSSREIIIEITCQTTTIIVGISLSIIYLAGCCITIIVGWIILITSEHLLTMDIRIEISYMLGITMTKTCSRETHTVIIDNHRTPYYLITSIPIHIGNDIVVITLTIPRRTWLVVGPLPANLQVVSLWIHIVCDELMAGIDTTAQEDAWMFAIQIRSTEEILAAAVTIAITPGCLQVCFSVFQALQRELDALVWLTGSTLAIPEELLAIMGKPFYGTRSLWLTVVGP